MDGAPASFVYRLDVLLRLHDRDIDSIKSELSVINNDMSRCSNSVAEILKGIGDVENDVRKLNVADSIDVHRKRLTALYISQQCELLASARDKMTTIESDRLTVLERLSDKWQARKALQKHRQHSYEAFKDMEFKRDQVRSDESWLLRLPRT